MLPVLRSKNPLGSLGSFFDDDFFKPTFNTFFDVNWKKGEDGNSIIEIEVPGFNKDNLKVEISDGILTVQGETESRKIYKKYQLGSIQEVKASIKDGILSLTLVEPEKQTTQIELTS